MLRGTADRKLESFKIFPYIAWGLIILFVFFVYTLTTKINDNAADLEQQSSSLEYKAKANTQELKQLDFED